MSLKAIISDAAMDQETARGLFEAGAMLVLLDVPQGTEIGIDMQSWQAASNFKGIKMIPPGIHVIYFRYSCSDYLYFTLSCFTIYGTKGHSDCKFVSEVLVTNLANCHLDQASFNTSLKVRLL